MLTAQGLAELLTEFDVDRGRILKLAEAARLLAKNDAAEQVASYCLGVANG